MLTCWIALTPCGDDAPGIEFAGGDRTDLLPLAALADAAVRARHPRAATGCGRSSTPATRSSSAAACCTIRMSPRP